MDQDFGGIGTGRTIERRRAPTRYRSTSLRGRPEVGLISVTSLQVSHRGLDTGVRREDGV